MTEKMNNPAPDNVVDLKEWARRRDLSNWQQVADTQTIIRPIAEALAGMVRAVHLRPLSSPEKSDLWTPLHKQIPDVKAALRHYGISLQGMPSFPEWDEMLSRPETKRAAEKMRQPLVLAVPPINRHELLVRMNTRAPMGENPFMQTFYFGDDRRWGSEDDSIDAWRSFLVEGLPEVPNDYSLDGTVAERTLGWVKKHQKVGLQAMQGPRMHLVFLMRLFAAGLGKGGYGTAMVLNPDMAQEDEKQLLFGVHRLHQAHMGPRKEILDHGGIVITFYDLRVRSCFELKQP